MVSTEDTNDKNYSNIESHGKLHNSILRDTQLIERGHPVLNIPPLSDEMIVSSIDQANSSDSFDLDDGTCDDNQFIGTDNDFIEYQYDQPRYSKKESVKMVDHNFAEIEANYIKNQDSKNDIILRDNESEQQSTSLPSPSKKIKQKELDIDDDSASDDEWKEIDTQLDYGDIYNNKGEKLDFFVHSQNDITQENTAKTVEKPNKKKTQLQKITKTGANVGKKVVAITAGVKIGRDEKEEQLREKYQRAHLVSNDNTKQGYTRIDEEEQAKKFGEMDKKFDFLFQNENSNLRKLHNASSNFNSSVDTISETTNDFMNTDNFDEIFNNEGHDDNELNPSIQMMSTKTMLNDSQKIAYAALVKLIIVQLTTNLITVRGSGTTKILKKLSVSHRSFMRWSMNVMNALYEHLDIKNDQEVKMIENLSCHGVETNDLTKWFNSNVSIENHLNDNKADNDIQLINMDLNQLENSETIEIDIKWTLICDLFLILLESSVYDARSRTLLLNFAEAIKISNLEIYQFERRITESLEIDETFEIINNNQKWDESDILKEHKKRQRNQKIVKIALATAAGGLVIGLSAGALAPVIGAGIAAGLTTVGIGGTSGFLAGTAGTAIITTTGVMSGMRAGKNAMSHRVGSVKTFEFIPLHNNRRVNLIITVSGWMSGTMDDVRLPFSTVDQVMGDLYSLLWEPEMLTSMGQTISILANEILTQSIQQILGSTLLITLMAGLQLPMMLSKLGYLLDNPWNNSLDRAWRSGKVLADTLRRKNLGVRPITLVGFSLGARLIYSCLLSLAKSGDYGIIENVYLFGSPIVINEDEMAQVRSVVSGRFVNGYVKQDWILGYLFRATSGGLRSIAGLSPINEEKYEVENFNCSEFVKGHMQYREAMPKLLRMAGWEVLDDQFVEIEQPNPEEEERQRKLLSDFEKAQHTKKRKTWYNKFFGKKNKEWWEMYEEGEKESENSKKSKDAGDGECDTDHDGNVVCDNDDTKNGMFNVEALKKEIENIEREAKKIEKKKSSDGKNYENKHSTNDSNMKSELIDDDSNRRGISDVDDMGKNLKKNSHESDSNSTGVTFNLTNKTEKTTSKPETNLGQRGLKKRASLIQLVEPSTNSEKKYPPQLQGNAQGQGQLRQFRIGSHGSRRSSNSTSGVKSPVVNLGLFQPVYKKTPQELEEFPMELEDKMRKEKLSNGNKNAETETGTDLNDFKFVDFGDYEINDENGVQVFYDDDIEAIEKKIYEEQKDKPGYGPVTGIDYGDEDEFPVDESHIQFSFE